MTDTNDLITCACCGYKTVTGDFQSCHICGWECDFAQESDPDFPVGANGRITLRQAQQNYIHFGACWEELRDRAEPPSPDDVLDPAWRSFPSQPDVVKDGEAWRRPDIQRL